MPMPNKMSELCQALKAAQKLAGEIFSKNPGIFTTNYHRKVAIDNFRDMEQVPGEFKFEPFDRGEWQWRASKAFEEVEFYMLLTAEDYEELNTDVSQKIT